jgi:hypothetical protein
MHPDIHILAACTDRKRVRVPNRLRLRSVAKGDPSSVAKAWCRRVKNERTETVVAGSLYAGDHWATVRQLATIVEQQGLTSKSFVISAGHGLVSVTSKIRPYSATFASSSPDSVTSRVSKKESRKIVLQTWWKEICAVGNASVNKPRSISALARRTPTSTFVVIASPNYLLALEQDLLTVLDILPDENQLIIISSNSTMLSQRLQDHIVPSIEPLQSVVGGALGSLHARVASLIFRNTRQWGLRADDLRKRLKRLAARSRPVREYHRKRLTDVQVRKFVRQGLRHSSRISCSALLQELRNGGFACEQRRFHEQFWSVKEKKHAT